MYKTKPTKTEQPLEFFKLDEIDRKVFVWLVNHVPPKTVMSWAHYIEQEYKRKYLNISANALISQSREFMKRLPFTTGDSAARGLN